MEAFYFGEQDQLFCIYHEANFEAEKNCGIVICNPFGQEYIRCHKAILKLAKDLSDAGYHVLRFDYLGTGDSYKDMYSVTLNDWRNNIVSAIEEIKQSCGIDKIIVIGLRLGASLVSKVCEMEPIYKVVLWNPIVNGADYCNELLTSHKVLMNGSFAKEKKNTKFEFESYGFPITSRLKQDIQSIDVTKIKFPPGIKGLMIANASDRFVKQFLLQNKNFDLIENVNGRFWTKGKEELNNSMVPLQEIKSIIDWLI
jgi:uncharacterized protein